MYSARGSGVSGKLTATREEAQRLGQDVGALTLQVGELERELEIAVADPLIRV